MLVIMDFTEIPFLTKFIICMHLCSLVIVINK